MNLYQKAVTQFVNYFIRKYPLHSYRKIRIDARKISKMDNIFGEEVDE